ncbi:hypothetical protein BDY19DRAFT_998523 [Irpex rosettiformis]|uniref:Uncharacterized protein n=1 Tax=Irpex rosettiformis TaxID=378272 RepID=A0ACB8TND1_9APHY|nr:hypothetical protein BDY19DRAFT_998523 [Irpex rosettiformis]
MDPDLQVPRCYIDLLPDDVLDNIIKTIHSSINPSLKDLCTWSLVCRQWYRIGTPYLFRCVALDFHGRNFACPQLDADKFVMFLKEKPAIADIIHQVKIHAISVNLGKILGLLPCVRNITLLYLTLQEGSRSDKDGGGFKLPGRLHYDAPDRVGGMELLKVLALFSEIGLLRISGVPALSDKGLRLATETRMIKNLRLHALVFDLSLEASHIRHLRLFRELGVLNRLTCLSVRYSWKFADELKLLNDVLHSASETLGEFYLDFLRYWRQATFDSLSQAPPDQDQAVQALSSGLGACWSLHGFCFRVLNYTTMFEEDDPDIGRWLPLAPHSWLVANALIACMPAENLKYLGFRFWAGDIEIDENTSNISWAPLCDNCRRFTHLRSFQLLFRSLYSFFDEEPSWQKERVLRELAEFEHVLVFGRCKELLPCEERNCLWSSKQ